jgi:hypothetical protein
LQIIFTPAKVASVMGDTGAADAGQTFPLTASSVMGDTGGPEAGFFIAPSV